MIATLRAAATISGSAPYSATVMPLKGALAAGGTLTSQDDASVQSSVLSTYDDGSAAVVVVCGNYTGTAGQSGTIRLHASPAAAAATPLTPATIASRVSSIAIAFGAYGTAQISDFTRPECVWWANGGVICARYRVTPPSSAGTALEAVIDIHAYSDRALVEIVVENCRMNSAAPVRPLAASYTGAIVSVNGSVVSTVNGNGGPDGNHSPFRAWYVSAWVGSDPGLRVTQAVQELQQHPLLFKCDQSATADFSVYAADSYTPWSTGRQRAAGMGNGGDHASIGPIPKWEAQALQSGDPRAWRAVEASALALVGYDINYRDSITGAVPTIAQVDGKDVAVDHDWPSLYGYSSNGPMSWETAHQPAVGMMAFAARPSPVYIELAQKVAIVNATATAFVGDGTYAKTGVFVAYQTRAKAWCMRALAHATFLTPASQAAWKAAGADSIRANFQYQNNYVVDPKAKLNLTWPDRPAAPYSEYNVRPSGAAFGTSTMQSSYLLVELHKIASAGMLIGSDQVLAKSVADWLALWPVRFINEQPDGRWRYLSIGLAMGRNSATINSPADWAAMREYSYPNQRPASASGPWMTSDTWDEPPTIAQYNTDPVAGAYYPSYFWSALVAAIERDVPGAAQAWATVQSGVVGLGAWRAGFGRDPRWGSTPRNR